MNGSRLRTSNYLVLNEEPAGAPSKIKKAYKLARIPQDLKKHSKFQIENLLEFYVVSVSLGTAYAHPSSGDTRHPTT